MPCVTFPIGTRGIRGRSFLSGLLSPGSELFLQGAFVLGTEIIVLEIGVSRRVSIKVFHIIKAVYVKFYEVQLQFADVSIQWCKAHKLSFYLNQSETFYPSFRVFFVVFFVVGFFLQV